VRPFPGWIQVQPALASVSSVTALPSADAVGPEETAGLTALPFGTADDADDDGLVGDGDVCAHPTTNTVPTTTVTAASDVRTDMENSFVNRDDAWVSTDGHSETFIRTLSNRYRAVQYGTPHSRLLKLICPQVGFHGAFRWRSHRWRSKSPKACTSCQRNYALQPRRRSPASERFGPKQAHARSPLERFFAEKTGRREGRNASPSLPEGGSVERARWDSGGPASCAEGLAVSTAWTNKARLCCVS
jgi:hypothetical protein